MVTILKTTLCKLLSIKFKSEERVHMHPHCIPGPHLISGIRNTILGRASIDGMEVQIVTSKTCMLDIVVCSEDNIISYGCRAWEKSIIGCTVYNQ